MDTVNQGINKIAFIILVVIVLVYAAGFATDAGAVTSGFVSIINSLLPGNIGNYPSNPPSASNAARQNVPPTARAGRVTRGA